jgi:hypothetical protein
MGRAAADAIRHLCDNSTTVERHIEFRRAVARREPTRSRRFPANIPWAGRPLRDDSARRAARSVPESGIAVVVTCIESGALLEGCLASVRQQTRAPAAVVVVADERRNEEARQAAEQARAAGWRVCGHPGGSVAVAKNAGVAAVLAAGTSPLGFVFIDAAERLHRDLIETCESVLERCPDVGLVSSWMRLAGDGDRCFVHPCPAFPYQLVANEAAPASAVRAEALREAGPHRTAMDRPYDDWDLVNAVLARGWVAVTFPRLLSERAGTVDHPAAPAHGMRQELLARFPEVVARDAQALVLLLEARARAAPGPQGAAAAQPVLGLRALLRRSLGERLTRVRLVARRPRHAARLVLWRSRRALARAVARFATGTAGRVS